MFVKTVPTSRRRLTVFLAFAMAAFAFAWPNNVNAASPICPQSYYETMAHVGAGPLLVDLNCTDSDGDTLTYTPTSWNSPPWGGIAVSGAVLTFTPPPAEVGWEGYDVDVSDGTGGSVQVSASFLVVTESDLTLVSLTPSASVVTRGDPVTYTAVVQNNGPSNASLVGLVMEFAPGVTFSSGSATCGPWLSQESAYCGIAELSAGGNVTLTVTVSTAAAVSSANVFAWTTGYVDDSTPGNDEFTTLVALALEPVAAVPADPAAPVTPVAPAPLPTKGTPGPDIFAGDAGANKYEGLAGNDKIAGAAGDDNLFGDGGDDSVNGEGGDDKVTGGKGKDKLTGGDGDDTVNARDKKKGDRVSCGAGKDVVLADKGDKIAKDCEKVKRK